MTPNEESDAEPGRLPAKMDRDDTSARALLQDLARGGRSVAEVKSLLEAAVQFDAARNPELFEALSAARRRFYGMWLGGGLSAATLVGAVIVALTNGPGALTAALVTIGATCAGSTFAVITGQTVSVQDFARALTVSGNRGLALQQREVDDNRAAHQTGGGEQ